MACHYQALKPQVGKWESIPSGKVFLPIISFLFSINFNLFAQEEYEHEIDSNVPVLAAFHEVIYPIWHTAYPEKDYDALRSFVPEVNKFAKNIYEAKLPGILRDKETKWKEGVAVFKKSVDDYNKAAEESDNQKLLDAAEVMHAKYEMLVRIIRPVLKEVDEFHKVLYIIYHKYLPDKKYENIGSICDDLKTKVDTMLHAKLPKRLEAKTNEYQKAVNELIESVNNLCSVLKGKDSKTIDTAVESMHTCYLNVEKIFD